MPIVPAQFSEASHKPDSSKLCFYFCHYQHVTLKGCVRCIFEEHTPNCERHFFEALPPPPPYFPLPPRPMPSRFNSPEVHHPFSRFDSIPAENRPNKQSMSQPQLFLQQAIETTTESSTPDWNRICVQLCRNGNGGILCRCDLPPF